MGADSEADSMPLLVAPIDLPLESFCTQVTLRCSSTRRSVSTPSRKPSAALLETSHTSSPDLLSAILDGQSLLSKRAEDIEIQQDGTYF